MQTNWLKPQFRRENISAGKYFGGKIFGEKKISAEKKFRRKNFRRKKNFGGKNFGEHFRRKFFPPKCLVVNVVENVQIRATKLVDGFSQLDYSERLRRLDIPTLIYRRARGDIIEIFKHFHSYDKNTLPNSFQPRDRIS